MVQCLKFHVQREKLAFLTGLGGLQEKFGHLVKLYDKLDDWTAEEKVQGVVWRYTEIRNWFR